MDNKQYIWNYLLNKGFSKEVAAGIMGNMEEESHFYPNNVQNTCPLSDSEYTRQVDNGSYTNFVHDGYGYGLVQWTYDALKQDLLNRCKAAGKSISDIKCQLDQLYIHLKSEGVYNELAAASSIEQATEIFMIKFERPKNQSQKAKTIRINYAKNIYNELKNEKGGNGEMDFTPIVCMQTNSTCYRQTSKMQIRGVLWHSTGCNNPWVKRYVQPSENDAKYSQLIALLGKNTAGNDWNHVSAQAGLNAWIGKIADGSVRTVQTMPWDYKPWGCGSGSRGSCNNGWIQFEICEDNLSNQDYFNQIYQEACKLTAYICKTYNLNPKGTVNFNGVNVPVILCHQDSAQLGLGSNHADVYHWFKRYGKDMNSVRNDVASLMGQIPTGDITPSTPAAGTYTGIIKKGESSTRVRDLQQNLIKLGYSCGKYGADGDFGKGTLEAVMKFQKDHGLDDDGDVGPLTLAAIDEALKALTDKPTTGIYRVRKEWKDASSQMGAFSNLDNAKALCNKLGSEYKVFDSNGNVVYSINSQQQQTQPTNTPSSTIITPAQTYATVMIGSASKDENGQYRGGQAGDQSGKEVYILNWYYQNWNVVLRPVDAELAEKIASACEQACGNPNIGYDQLQRNTFYLEAKKVGFNIGKVLTPCECDCASLVGTCCICAGLPEAYYYVNNNLPTTSNLRSACLNTGKFAVLTDSKYLTQKDYLKRGDILVNETQHAVIVLADGTKAEKSAVVEAQKIETVTKNFEPYIVRITAQILNVRAEPDKDSAVKGAVTKGQAFTIVDEKGGWGKLKSGVGWIDLSYTQKR